MAERRKGDQDLKDFLAREAHFMGQMSDSTDRGVLKAEAGKLLTDYLQDKGLSFDDAKRKGFFSEVRRWIDRKLAENQAAALIDDDTKEPTTTTTTTTPTGGSRRARRRRRVRAKVDEESTPEPVEDDADEVIDYESLTDDEVDGLPGDVQDRIRQYRQLEDILDLYDVTTAEDERTEIQALAEALYEELTQTPIVRVIVQFKLVGLVGADAQRVRAYFEGVIARYEGLFAEQTEDDVDLIEANVDGEMPEFVSLRLGSHVGKNEYPGAIAGEYARIFVEYSPEVAYRSLLEFAEAETLSYFNANSGLNGASKLIGLFKVLKAFGKKKGEMDVGATRGEHFEKFQPVEDGSGLSEEQVLTLRSKATEVICVAYLHHAALPPIGHSTSLASDWEKVAELGSDDEDFGVGTLDSLLQEEAPDSYEYAPFLNWLMVQMPLLIREFEEWKGSPWNDRHEGEKEAFKEWLIDYSSDGPGSSRNIVAGRLTGLLSEIIDNDGEAEGLSFDVRKARKLLDAKEIGESSEFDILLRIAMSMSTALGVRQHTFRHDLAKGATPAGGVAKHKRWMVAACPYAHFNYKCYKTFTPHLTTEGFSIQLGSPLADDPNDPDGLTINEKVSNINASNALSRFVIEAVADLRQAISIGDLRSKEEVREFLEDRGSLRPDEIDQIVADHEPHLDNIYPDLYSFVVLQYESRKYGGGGDQVAGFEAWYTGLVALEKFVEHALGQPLGTANREEIKKHRDNPKAARDQMITSFGTLVRDILSPIKSNQGWVRWDHIAQFILMYIDKMQRVYSLIDESEGGRAVFTRQIRRAVARDMVNLAKLAGQDEHLLENVATHIDNSSGRPKVKVDEDLGYPTNTQEKGMRPVLALSDEDYGISRRHRGRLSSGATIKRKWDMRDYVLNRMARATGEDLVPRMMKVNYALIDDGGSVSRARASLGNDFDALVTRRRKAWRIISSRYLDRVELGDYYSAADKLLFGTPTSDQKKTTGDGH